MFLELPVVYTENIDELRSAEEQGVKCEAVETVDKTAFFIPNDCLIRINPSTNKNRTTLSIELEDWSIDLDYETVLMLFKDAFKVPTSC